MAARKKAASKKNGKPGVTTTGTTQLYPEGVPTSEAGTALEDVKITRKRGKDLPLDAESARVAEQHKNVMGRKSRGETGVRWNSDYRIRYGQCVELHPYCKVSIKQIEPVEDENIAARPASILRTYDDLIAYVRDNHWKGDRAAYKWVLYDDTQPQWATGIIRFNEDPRRVQRLTAEPDQEEPELMDRRQQPPPHQWGGYGGYPPQSPYGAPAPPYGQQPPPFGSPYPQQIPPGYAPQGYPPGYPQQPGYTGYPAPAPSPGYGASYPPAPQAAPPHPLPPEQSAGPPPSPQQAPAPQQQQQPPPAPYPYPPPAAQPSGTSDSVVTFLIDQVQNLARDNTVLREDLRRNPVSPPQAATSQPQTPPATPTQPYPFYPYPHPPYAGYPPQAPLPGQPPQQPQQPQQQPQQPQAQSPQYPPEYWAWYWTQGPGAGAHRPPEVAHHEAPPPEPPPNPIQQVRDTLGMLGEMHLLARSFGNAVSPAEQAAPEEPPPPPEDDDFPLKTKEVGPLRYTAINGEIQRDLVSMGLGNFDKAGPLIGKAWDKVTEFWRERERAVDRHAEMRKQKIRDMKEMADQAERYRNVVGGAPTGSPPAIDTTATTVEPQPQPQPQPQPRPQPIPASPAASAVLDGLVRSTPAMPAMPRSMPPASMPTTTTVAPQPAAPVASSTASSAAASPPSPPPPVMPAVGRVQGHKKPPPEQKFVPLPTNQKPKTEPEEPQKTAPEPPA